jgi:hypothetical protein
VDLVTSETRRQLTHTPPPAVPRRAATPEERPAKVHRRRCWITGPRAAPAVSNVGRPILAVDLACLPIPANGQQPLQQLPRRAIGPEDLTYLAMIGLRPRDLFAGGHWSSCMLTRAPCPAHLAPYPCGSSDRVARDSPLQPCCSPSSLQVSFPQLPGTDRTSLSSLEAAAKRMVPAVVNRVAAASSMTPTAAAAC